MLSLVALAGCFKEESYDTTLVLRPTEQTESGGDYVSLSGVVAYAYAADTTYYCVVDYDAALAGIVTNKESGAVLAPIATATAYTAEELEDAIAMQTDREEIMLVAVDTKSEGYAYANYTVGINLPTTYITLAFRPWKEGKYLQGKWMYFAAESIDEPTDE